MFVVVVIIVVVLFFVFRALWNEKIDNDSQKYYASLPMHITNPATDLRTNQKFAVLRILAFVQGCSPKTAYGFGGNEISQTIFNSLGISREEAVRVLKVDMYKDPEKVFQEIFDCLDEIRDRQYLKNLGDDLWDLALISGDPEAPEAIKNFFGQLLNERA